LTREIRPQRLTRFIWSWALRLILLSLLLQAVAFAVLPFHLAGHRSCAFSTRC
jgi:hypothetical protein